MDNTKCIYRNARVIDPATNTDEIRDVGVENGVFADPAKLGSNAKIIDLKGYVLAPGFTDIHVHLRQPGNTNAETIRTGTLAAAAGGFTSIVPMPNTSPCTDNPGTVQLIMSIAQKDSPVHILPCAAMTKNLEGQEMTGIGGLKSAGVIALSDDGKCVQNHELMRHIVEYSRTFDLPILDHCEDTILASGGVMHEGHWSVFLGMKGMSGAAEELMVARDAILARMADWKIHIQHISCKHAINILRQARKNGIRLSGEATPHHFTLTDVEIKRFDTNYKMNPPLRSEEDRMALIEALQDGTVTVIATDHAPHTPTAKNVEFDYAPFGIVGLETAVPVSLTELYHKKYLTLSQLIAKFTTGPAEVLGLPIGTLEIGRAADITILDTEKEFTVDPETFRSKGRNTPFGGYKAKGCAAATIVDGKCVYSTIAGLPAEE